MVIPYIYQTSKYVSNCEYAFNSYFITPEHKPHLQALKEIVLSLHPKTITRKKFITKLRSRDETNVLWQECQIPLLFKCHYTFATMPDDPLFYGSSLSSTTMALFGCMLSLLQTSGTATRLTRKHPLSVLVVSWLQPPFSPKLTLLLHYFQSR